MKNISFKLLNPVRLIPIKGKSTVKIETDGSVMVQNLALSEPRAPRYRTLVDTGKAKLKLSAHGLFRKVEIRLRGDEASRADFLRELNTLFDEELFSMFL